MASKWLPVCCALFVLSSVAACGGDDDSGGGAGLPGSVSRDEHLEDLDEDQVVDLCETLDDQLADVVSERDAIRLSCTLSAYTTSIGGNGEFDEDACEASVETCVEDGAGEPTTTSECDADELLSSAEGCELTAGDLVDCLNANARQVAEAVDSITCSTLADDPESIDDAFGDLAACMDLEEDCPEVLDVGGDDGAGDEGPIGGEPPASGCEDTCGPDGNGEWAGDGTCDDGGPDSEFDVCPLGADCMDCGER